MKIEIILSDNINERCPQMTSFNTPTHILVQLENVKAFGGVVIINGIAIKFFYSPMGDDGDIFCEEPYLRSLVKSLIPLHTLILNT